MITLKDNIKVGDYVRTTIGEIGKIIDCPEQLKQNYGNWLWFETKEEQRPIRKEDIKTSSPNIIDLIEEDDFINQARVSEIIKKTKDSIRFMADSDYEFSTELKEKEITSIVTKEQFEAMEYKIER